jgi:hypothetical protein
MNVEIWAETALFPEKEYINGIVVAVYVFSFFIINYTGSPSYTSVFVPERPERGGPC